MWILRKLDNNDKFFYLISVKGSYSVGRKNKDITLEDESISRTHCTIKIAKNNECPFPVTTPTGIWIIDDASKYGTFIRKNDYEKIPNKVPIKLEHKTIVRFGIMNNTYRVEYKPISMCTSLLPKPEMEECKRILNEIDGVFKSTWDKQCSMVIVDKVQLTPKVVLALIEGVPVVLPGYLKELAESVKNQTPKPDYKLFKPPLAEKALKENLVIMDVTCTRKELFKGKTFLVPTKQQFSNLKEIITAAGGRIEVFDVNGNWHIYGRENYLIIRYPFGASDEIVLSFKNNQEMLQEKYRKRIIPECEIPQAIAYASIEKFCNPKFVFQIHKTLEESSKGEVIEEETPVYSEDLMQDGSKNVIPGSVTEGDENSSIMFVDEKAGNSKKRGRSPDVPTPSKKRTLETGGRNSNSTNLQIESQLLMTEDGLSYLRNRNANLSSRNFDKSELESQSLITEERGNTSRDKTETLNKKNLEKNKTPSAPKRVTLQIDNDPEDDFWTSSSSSQAKEQISTKRKQSVENPPPRIDLAKRKKSDDALPPPPQPEPVKRKKSNDTSPPRAEPASKKSKPSEISNPFEKMSTKKDQAVPSPNPSSGSSSNGSCYAKTTISSKDFEDEDGWISVKQPKEIVKKEENEELNTTVVMLNLVSIIYVAGEEKIKEAPTGFKNVKRFKKQSIKSSREFVPVEEVNEYDSDEDWNQAYCKVVSQFE